jgi:nitroreductase
MGGAINLGLDMKKKIRRLLGFIVHHLLSERWVRIIKKPALLPGYYKMFSDEIEPIIDSIPNEEMKDSEYWEVILRKSVHILDKGLCRQDFEPGHSAQWYETAKIALGKIGYPPELDPSVEWASSKIKEYEVRQTNPTISEQSFTANVVSEDDYHALLKVIQGRRSIRNFSNQPVESKKLNTIINVINWSPSSCNRQPAKVFIAEEAELVRQCAKTCAGATCFSGDGACFIAFCADLRPYNLPEEFLLPDLDLGLGIQNCLLVAHALGISMTLLSWAQHTSEDDQLLRKLLKIPTHYRIVINCLAGYPSQWTDVPARKSLDATLVNITGD